MKRVEVDFSEFTWFGQGSSSRNIYKEKTGLLKKVIIGTSNKKV